MTNAIIFDMDGVLIDSQPLHYKGDQLTLAAYGVDATIEEMTAYAGTTNQLRFTLFKEKYHLEEDIQTMIEKREELMIELVKNSTLGATQGCKDLLKSIKEMGLKTAVASSSSYPFINAVLEKIEVKPYFDLIFSGEAVPNGKPAPDVFLETAKQLNELPKHCVVIEDSANGVLAATRAHMRCVGYQNPTSGNQDLSKATKIIDDFRTIDAKWLCALH